ncbi:MAG: hypothetical protein ACLP1X_33070 [Polyangiaceae bacterium]
MGRVTKIVANAILASALGGCASISGLNAFTGGDCVDDCDASVDSPPSDETTTATTSPENDPIDATDGPGNVDWPDATGADEAPPSTEMESGSVDSGSDGSGAGSLGADAGNHSDAAPEGGGCGPQTCSTGCCDDHGNCTVTSASTCGTGGVSCQDCASGGQVCSGGSCATPDAGGGGATCTPSTCLNICVPYFHECCKSDQTCGCSLNFPTGPCE